jgi:hypothetical protein
MEAHSMTLESRDTIEWHKNCLAINVVILQEITLLRIKSISTGSFKTEP